MTTGTLTLTQNSTAVTGSGTAFTTDLSVGDVIFVALGGVNYTLVVSAIASNTALTLSRAFIGNTASGVAWTAVPRDSLIGIHAQIAADTAWSRRSAILDKQNWMQLLTGSGNVTITLPDGTTFSGPAWSYITSIIAGKAAKGANGDITSLSGLTTALSLAQGGTGLSNPFGTIAGSFCQGNDNRLNTVSGKTGGNITSGISVAGSVASLGNTVDTGSTAVGTTTVGFAGTDAWHDAIVVNNTTRWRFGITGIGSNPYLLWQGRNLASDTFSSPLILYPTDVIYTTRNTTKASDGTLKAASPIVKIFSDGRSETNAESEGCTVTRIATGEYLIDGCTGLNADAGWGGFDGGFDIPTDRNKQPLIWLDYKVMADGSVLVRTYHRTHPDAPAFARNERDGYSDGDPIDIPSDQFVSVRVEMPPSSIFNLKMREAEEAARKTEAAEEAAEKDAE